MVTKKDRENQKRDIECLSADALLRVLRDNAFREEFHYKAPNVVNMREPKAHEEAVLANAAPGFYSCPEVVTVVLNKDFSDYKRRLFEAMTEAADILGFTWSERDYLAIVLRCQRRTKTAQRADLHVKDY